MSGSHASTLERLYAWEKKLYLEVKVCLQKLSRDVYADGYGSCTCVCVCVCISHFFHYFHRVIVMFLGHKDVAVFDSLLKVQILYWRVN
jgi:hypothetical protein